MFGFTLKICKYLKNNRYPFCPFRFKNVSSKYKYKRRLNLMRSLDEYRTPPIGQGQLKVN